MLEVANLSLAYGLHRALDGVTLNVGRGEIVTILGANGAGKTSLLKAIAGVVRTLPGKQVSLGGRDISSLPALANGLHHQRLCCTHVAPTSTATPMATPMTTEESLSKLPTT